VRRVVTIVGIVAGSALVLLALLWVFQRSLIYFPSDNLPNLAIVLPDAEEVRFTTQDDLTLSAWLVPTAADANGVTVVVFSGNAGNRGDRLPLAQALTSIGYRVLLTDYRGYGGNPGRPTEEGLLLDARAAVNFLEGRTDVDADRLVYFGESLGAAVAIGLAVDRPPAALVLRSPFTSLSDVASVHYPFLPTSLLLWDRFPNVERLQEIDVPVLVVAGSADRVVPIAQSRSVYEAASEPKEMVVIEGADHNNNELAAGAALVSAVTAFLRSVDLSSSQ